MDARFWKMAKAMHKAAVLSQDYTQYAAVVSQVLDAYLSNEDVRLEFDPDRNFGWGNRRSVLIAGQDKFSLRFPATLVKELVGEIYLERVKKKMTTKNLKVLLIVKTGLLGWESQHERTLRRTEVSVAEFKSMLEHMDFEFAPDLFLDIDLTFARDNERRAYEENKGTRKISFVLSVTGTRENEWSGFYNSRPFDLDTTSPEDILGWISEHLEVATKRAIEQGDRRAFSTLVTEATDTLLGGRYGWKWISHESELVGACGGRSGYRWEYREETGELVLFENYSGIVKGMDGTNRPWGAVLVIGVKKTGEQRNFQFLVEPLSYKMEEPKKAEIRTALAEYRITLKSD